MIKKYLKKYLKKHLRTHPDRNYYFLRWLADLAMNDIDVLATKLACNSVAIYTHNNPEKFPTDIFNDVFVLDKTVYIYTYRPGFWIGKYGTTISEILSLMNNDENGNKILNFEASFIEADRESPICMYHTRVSNLKEY